MKKKTFALVMVAVMLFTLMGCSFTKTETRTESVTDANGNTTTTTTVISSQNGKQTETTTVEQSTEEATEAATEDDKIVATMAFDNQTGVSIYTMKFSSAQSDDWGEDILGEFAPLEDGETITFHDKFTYHTDNILWDLKAADENDNAIEFKELDLSNAADPQNISIVLTYDAESDSFCATVQ